MSANVEAAIRRGLGESGAGEVRVVGLLPGGANNRVYRIQVNGRDVVAKVYFQHPEDRRNRLDAEFGFASFAWNAGVRALPRPIARFDSEHLALYEFIPGRPVDPEEVDDQTIAEAVKFYLDVNRDRGNAASLPDGSEACFSLAEHFACIGGRMERLKGIEPGDDSDNAARSFVEKDLDPAWDRLRERSLLAARKVGIGLHEVVDEEERCLSPSDFGFHNSILGEDGRLRFIDFEYAGWDDPARMICDFFCQCKVPVPSRFFESFARSIAERERRPEACAARASLLLPLFRLKWCCILLNEFLLAGAQRRRFAATEPSRTVRTRQLAKARRMLALVDSEVRH